MWHPEPGWQALPGGSGASTYGVWLATWQGRAAVVKRLAAPEPDAGPDASRPRSHAYWHREVDVALDGLVADTAGLRAAPVLAVEEDEEGATLVSARVAPTENPGLFVARALGRFAATALPDRPWLARDQLRDRLARVEHRGGWGTLERTMVADVADRLWQRRHHYLARLDDLPQVAQHGDPALANLVGRADDDTVVALDWAGLGTGPVGADLGLLTLAAREGVEPLLDAYLAGLAEGGSPGLRDQVLLASRVSAVYTALSRAEWALARVAAGEGALAGKFRHPSVAPYLHSLQRQYAQVEALL